MRTCDCMQVYDKGMLSAALSIIKDDGPTVLLGGLGSTVVGYGIEGAMKFGVYEVCKPIMTKLIKGSKGAAYIAASVFAGAVASILLCPMESTRIRQVTDPEYADKGLMAAFPQLVKEEGFGPMFSGIWAMLSKQVSIPPALFSHLPATSSLTILVHVLTGDLKFVALRQWCIANTFMDQNQSIGSVHHG